MTEVVNIRAEKDDLRYAIAQWAMLAPSDKKTQAWQEVEGAILGLDNAAYDRAYGVAHKRCHDECYDSLVTQVVAERQEIARLKRDLEDERAHREHVEAERDEARRDTTTMTLANDDKRQLLRRMRYERNEVWVALDQERNEAVLLRRDRDYRKRCAEDWHQTAIDRASEIEHLTTERDLARTELKREATDAGHLARERNDARAEIERLRAQLCAELISPTPEYSADYARLQAELADARETIRKMAEGRVGTLRKALETLADRYHAQMCWSKPQQHQRQTCPRPLQAVEDTEKALAGETHFVAGRPKEDPDIEAVLIGSTDLACADGCGRVVKQGDVMYRRNSSLPDRRLPSDLPLYASEECARKAEEYHL